MRKIIVRQAPIVEILKWLLDHGNSLVGGKGLTLRKRFLFHFFEVFLRETLVRLLLRQLSGKQSLGQAVAKVFI